MSSALRSLRQPSRIRILILTISTIALAALIVPGSMDALVLVEHHNSGSMRANAMKDSGLFSVSFDHTAAVKFGGEGVVGNLWGIWQQTRGHVAWENFAKVENPDVTGGLAHPATYPSDGQTGECNLISNLFVSYDDELPMVCEVVETSSDGTGGTSDWLHLVQCTDRLSGETVLELPLVQQDYDPDQWETWLSGGAEEIAELLLAISAYVDLQTHYDSYYLWYCEAETKGALVDDLPPLKNYLLSAMIFRASVGGSTVNVGNGYGGVGSDLPAGVNQGSMILPYKADHLFKCPDTHQFDALDKSCVPKCPPQKSGDCGDQEEEPECPAEGMVREENDDGTFTCKCPPETPHLSRTSDGSGWRCSTREEAIDLLEPPNLQDAIDQLIQLVTAFFNGREMITRETSCVPKSTYVTTGTWQNPQTGEYLEQGEVRRVMECTTRIVLRQPWQRSADLDGVQRRLLFDGLTWYRHVSDPQVTEPVVYPPPVDLMAVFGPCHSVGEVLVTPCEEEPVVHAGPNLKVIGISAAEAAPLDPWELAVTVQNTGGETAPNTEYEVTWTHPDGSQSSQWGWVGSLQPGAVRTYAVRSDLNSLSPFLAVAGSYLAEFEADQEDWLDEADELDNKASLHLSVSELSGPGPDLRALPLSFDLANPVEGQEVTISFGVENFGSASVPATTFRVVAGWLDGTMSTFHPMVPPLGAGQRWTGSVSVVAETPGQLTVTVFADALAEVQETDEGNNLRTRYLEVHPLAGCGPCTSGDPNHLGARLCFDPASGPPASGSMWECLGVRADGTTCVASGDHPNGWAYGGSRCPDPATLCSDSWHPDRCGVPDVCPGTADCG